MKTLKNDILLNLSEQPFEGFFVKSLDIIEKTYLAMVSAAFILTAVNFIKVILA